MSDLTDWDDDILDKEGTDEGIIELTSIVEDDLENEVDDETIIELTDIAEEDAPGLGLDITTDDYLELEDQVEIEDQIKVEDQVEVEKEFDGLELETESLGEDVSNEIEVAAIQNLITQEQVEAALERVIENKFADKIEAILFEKMEKVIEREIADIKESLQKDLDQIGSL
jgi:hypothetical protein